MNTASMGADIYWEEHGAGPPIILLHGNGQDSGMFSGQIPALSKDRRVIVIDSRGHGRSSAGSRKLRLSDMAGDLAAVMDAAGLDKADILGFSDGGNIAMIFAVKYPERVRSLILSGANSVPSGLKFKYYAWLWLIHPFITLGTVFSQKCCREKERLDLMLYEPDLKVWDLEGIKCPTLITAGANDLIRPSHTDYLAATIPKSVKHIFPGDHFSPQKLSAEYNDIVIEFLNFLDKNDGKG